MAEETNSNCLFNNYDYKYLKYKIGVGRSLKQRAYEEIFSPVFPNELVLHNYAFCSELKCENCLNYVSCRSDYLKEIERKTKSHIEKLEVPTLTQIHQHKVTELMYKLEDMILNGEHKPMKDLVNQIENHMLKDVTAALIELSLNQQIGYPYTKEKLESSSKRKKGASEGYTRLFLTVGSMDKAKKKDIIHFLVSKANIRESDIQGIDIKRKFTFVNINDKAIKKVMQHCLKEKLNGRKVEIEQANSR